MTEETRQPRPNEAVLGGNTPDLSTTAVLGAEVLNDRKLQRKNTSNRLN